MRKIHILTALVLTAALSACPAAKEAEKKAEPTKEEAAKPDPATLSILTEEGFAARHPKTADGAWPEFKGEEVMLGPMKGYLTLPKDVKAPLPAVIVIHERWGLDEDIKLWCDRLAEDGYAALAIDLFGGKTTRDPNEANQLYFAARGDTASAQEIFRRAQSFLQTDPRIKAVRIATLGFAQGGMWAYRGAVMMSNPAAVVDYYGLPLLVPTVMQSLKAPVLMFFAGKDISCPPKAVDFVEQQLSAAAIPHDVERYPAAAHAFANPQTGTYDAQAAADSWKRTQAFLAEHVKTPTDAERKALEAEAAGADEGAAADAKPAAGAAKAKPKAAAKKAKPKAAAKKK